MKKFSERDIRKLELLGTATALLVAALCVMYLFDIAGNGWILQFLLILGIILHLIVALTDFVRKYYWRTAISLWLLLMFLTALFYLR